MIKRESTITFGWNSPSTFMGTPYVSNSTPAEQGGIAILGVPFGSTVTSRQGTHLAPQRLRQDSCAFAQSIEYLRGKKIYDCLFDQEIELSPSKLHDLGDVDVYPTEIPRTLQRIKESVNQIVEKGQKVLLLGGDHTVTIGGFEGLLEQGRIGAKIGYLHIDHHFDFGQSSNVFGTYYRGATSRRVLELIGKDFSRIFYIGQGDYTSAEQLGNIRKESHVITLADILRYGVENVKEPLQKFCDSVDLIYVSFDIDVLSPSYASATGTPSLFGLDPLQLMHILFSLDFKKIRILDVVEYNPTLDYSGQTSFVLLQILYRFISLWKD